MSKKTFKIPTVNDMDDTSFKATTSSFSKFQKLDKPDTDQFTAVKDLESKICDKLETSEEKQQITTADSNDNNLSTCSKNLTESSAGSAIGSSSAIRSVIVNGRQKGNPVLKFLRNVPWEWGETPADYVLGASCCALFLSVKFHKLHPEYIHERFKKVGKTYALQILLLQIDVAEPENVLRELNSMCFMAGWTLILSWSAEETAEYIESFKIYENKPAEFLMGKQNENDEKSKFVNLLTSIRSVTKTDAENLIEAFGSLKAMTEARVEDLALCNGIGLKKAKRLFDAFDETFCNSTSKHDNFEESENTHIEEFEDYE